MLKSEDSIMNVTIKKINNFTFYAVGLAKSKVENVVIACTYQWGNNNSPKVEKIKMFLLPAFRVLGCCKKGCERHL